MPFDEVVELALYHPTLGFYSRGRGAGRNADFLTSPEVGPLFGAVVARALDSWWAEMRRPDPFVVVEAGAGVGTLAAAVLAARPDCGPALRYVLVERSAALRHLQASRLSLEPAALVLGPVLTSDPDLGPYPASGAGGPYPASGAGGPYPASGAGGPYPASGAGGPGAGPLATALAELPPGPFDGVVIANELLDNLPFRLLQRSGDPCPGQGPSGCHPNGWDEVRVGHDLGEVLVPAPPELATEADLLAPDAPPGGRIPIQARAGSFLRAALGALGRGRVAVIDYGDSTAGLARRPWTDWVRTYRAQGRGGHPLTDLGAQDVTCEVAFDQLARRHPPARQRSQADFLHAHGLADLVAEARRGWEEGAHVGDLAALAARSRVTEAPALTDSTGLGAFRVLEWDAR